MPELPEVETIRCDLNRLIVGKKIVAVRTNMPKQLQPSPAAVKKAAIGAKITQIGRQAKALLIYLDNGLILAVHLKLTGRLLVRKKGDPADDWVRATIVFSDDGELRFADLRQFGWIRVVDARGLEKLLAEFGPEPFADLTLEKFKATLASSRRPVKVVLMDQKKISGLGNIYATEALFLAKIDPRRSADQVSAQEVKKLYEAIQKVLKAGLKYRGASDQHYLDALGQKGHYQEHFLVYARQGEKCFHCGGKIEKVKLAGRGTCFCPKCQR